MSKKDLKKVVSREKRFSSLAKQEGKSNAKLAKKAKGENKKDLEWEVKQDKKFSKIRMKRAKEAEKKL